MGAVFGIAGTVRNSCYICLTQRGTQGAGDGLVHILMWVRYTPCSMHKTAPGGLPGAVLHRETYLLRVITFLTAAT